MDNIRAANQFGADIIDELGFNSNKIRKFTITFEAGEIPQIVTVSDLGEEVKVMLKYFRRGMVEGLEVDNADS